MTRPVVTSGRLTTSPNAPSSVCLHSSTTVRLKFGSLSCGIDKRNAGANDLDVIFISLAGRGVCEPSCASRRRTDDRELDERRSRSGVSSSGEHYNVERRARREFFRRVSSLQPRRPLRLTWLRSILQGYVERSRARPRGYGAGPRLWYDAWRCRASPRGARRRFSPTMRRD